MMRLGLVGTGLMGSAMVRRLLACGHEVTIWNREPEVTPPLQALGASAAPTPRAVAEAVEVTLLCVLDAAAVRDCVFGPAGVAAAQRTGPPGLLVDLSTISPDSTRDFAARLHQATGTGWVDAPMSGGPAAAEAGRLTVMAGGSAENLARATPALQALAANITHMGEVGAGQVTKLVNQALVGAGFVLLAEALAMAEAAGIDAGRLPACLAGGFADSTLLAQVFPAMHARQFEPKLGYARQLDKDMRAVQDFAEALGLKLPVVAQAVGQFAAFVAAGYGMEDSRAIGRLYGP